jgi:hypothetical protein
MTDTASMILAPHPDMATEDLAAAFPSDGSAPDKAARLRLMKRLHGFYSAYLGSAEEFQNVPRLNCDPEITLIEDEWLRWEDAQVTGSRLPENVPEFLDWFRQLGERHVQPDFCRYLADVATLDEIALFVLAEELVDSRFDDLVAMTQVGSAGVSKLTMAENYWDEMGEGKLEAMHTRLFEQSAVYMRRRLADRAIDAGNLHGTEIYENAALVLMYGIHRHLVPRALGAMGLMEYTAPVRFQATVDGCSRLGVPAEVMIYQRVHIHVDADHGTEWLDHVLVPLAERSPAALREIVLGMLTRERVASAYYRHVWQQMKALR